VKSGKDAVTFFFGKRILDRFEFLPEDSHHIVRVLRYDSGDIVWAIDGSGTAVEVALDEVSPRCASGVVVRAHADYKELPQSLILVCGMIQHSKMDWLVEKSVELGTHRIHTVTSRAKPGPGRLMRWSRIARSAAKQCKRGFVPQIDLPVDLEEVVSRLPSDGFRILADPGGSSVLPEGIEKGPVTVAVGPESGFTVSELDFLKASEFMPVSLGKRRLRAETAAIAALTLVAQGLEKGCVPGATRGPKG
jgi:16S rRNA (uracil1498-N3)-methyltransferase